jgi:pectin methylesterase-like acyl-CoA thioesterase
LLIRLGIDRLLSPMSMPTIVKPASLLARVILPLWLAASVFGAETPKAPLALDLHSAFPAANATDVCPDTPLRLTFPAPPTLGSAGQIRIVDAADNRVVATIDVSSPTATKAIGGLPDYQYYPVIIAGNEATIFPRNGALAYGRTYYVTIDAGVFKDGAAAYAGIDQPTAWRFATKTAPPAAGTAKLTVAADGTGDFCTVQGALDFIPDGSTTPTTIFLRKGTYTEMVFFTDKHAITLMGEDRRQCVIAYATNERFNPAGGNPYAGSSDPSAASHAGGHIYHRGVFLAHRANDLTLANLTIRNTTPQGGSQAEAIILNGTPAARTILKDVDLYSYQDTLQINGQAYLSNCHIEGDVDFMWGTGPCFFEDCSCRALRSGAYYTQIRNPATNHGYVYLHCTFDGLPGITGNYLSRIGTGRFPHSEVVLLDCTLGSAVGPAGWLLSGGREGNEHDPAQVHFWEYNSHDDAGQPVDVSLRLAGSRQLRQPDDAATIADYSDPAFVLGHDWNPRSAPILAPTPR